ncbi:MAG TPA: DUF1549 domain-containing protein [Bryobacteraceae bacterium]
MAAAAAALCVCGLSQSAPERIDFQREVHPLLASRCLGCHSAEKRSGGLSLATYDDVLNGGRSGAVVRPGNSAGSLIVQRITGPAATRMPLGGTPLSPAEIGVITSWIEQGARASSTSAAAKPKWEAPLALARPAAPAPVWKNWSGPVDRFTAAYLASHAVSEPDPVADAVYARRVYFDIWGLPPSPAELQAFLEDRRADKRPKLVARLLADNGKYAENWISYWNDLLRNEEGVNYYSETAGRKSITAWLLAALESNLRYDQWIEKLLNPSAPGDPDGFLTGVNWRGTVSASQAPAMQAAQNSAQIFLGINLKCNSCHDSFISKWKLKDAYSLAAYFSAEERLQLYRCDIAQQDYASARFLYPELNREPVSASPADRRAAAARIFTDPRNGRMPRTLVNRVWQRLMGRGIVADVDEMDGEPWSPELLDALASDFVDSGYDLKALIAEILNSRTYQLPAIARTAANPKEYVFRGPELRRLTAEEFADAVSAITGDWPVTTRALPSMPASSGSLAGLSGAPLDGAGVVNRPAPQRPATSPAPAPAAPPPASTPVPPGYYAREWRIAGSSLDRALGRPIRDQVYSTRDTQATTIQALELVNGERLTHWLWRGARKMLGELPPEPAGLLARQISAPRSWTAPFDIDITGAQKLYLIVEDALSTAPDKASPVWTAPELVGPNGAIPLDAQNKDALHMKLGSTLVFDIAGKGYTHLRGAMGFERVALIQGESVQAQFFVFDRAPSMDRLVPPHPEKPQAALEAPKTISETVDRVYWHTLGRAPNASERRTAEAALRDPARPGAVSADGLADLLWAVLMTPEFQFIR